ncbi:SIS domain-containing protein [Propioniciclava soli]|uniref:SIS domain-containing protein n=1 Tax=Propioniciclava soli TaxID=2775081 RepID=A0ABZ3C4X5_9ACTN
MPEFDDGRLDDADVLAAADGLLRPLAEAGARVRREASLAADALAGLTDESRPRAVIAIGPEARLLRALLEPVCPVPFLAWPSLGLPGWVGPLDLVVVLGGTGQHAGSAVAEALRRGSRLLVVAPEGSTLARQSASRAATLLPVSASSDPFPVALTALAALHAFGLGPAVSAEGVADAFDAVALDCGHGRDLAENPAKRLALELADAEPFIWGGSVLAARASRRIAEAVRTASGRVALAADAGELLPLLAATPPRDPFADPFADPADAGAPLRPTLVVVDDDLGDAETAEQRAALEQNAEAVDVRVSRVEQVSGEPLERYATVLATGLFAAAYLQIGLARDERR